MLSGQDGHGGVEDGVAAGLLVGIGDVDLAVGGDAKLGELAAGVAYLCRRESHAPATGQVGSEGQAASATSGVAHDGDARQVLHDRDKIVGRRETGTVAQHHHGLAVVHAAGIGGEVVVVGLGKVVVPGAGLVAEAAHHGLAGDEALDEGLDVGEIAAAVVAHVDDEPVAAGKVAQYGVEVAVAYLVFKAAIVHIAQVIAQDLVLDAAHVAVVEVEIVLVDDAAVVVHGILLPYPVARHVAARDEIGVPVFELLEHVAAQVEELAGAHARRQLGTIHVAHRVPVDVFVLKEGVMLVDDGPQGVEVALGVVGKLLLLVAGREQQEQAQGEQDDA